MYLNCPRCRTSNESDSSFCRNCGGAFSLKQTTKKSIVLPLMIIGSILAVCGFCGVFGLITGNKKQISQSSNSTIKPLVSSASPENNSDTASQGDEERMATVISDKANLRKTNSAKSEVVGTLSRDSTIEVVKQNGAWFYVRAIGGQSGWVHGNTIRLKDGINKTKPAKKPTVESQITASPKNEPTKSEGENTDSADIDLGGSTGYITGPRGGCYYINRNGNKTYVDRSLCRSISVVPYFPPSSSGNGGYIRGPRGGCYYLNRNGNKSYVDRSLCN